MWPVINYLELDANISTKFTTNTAEDFYLQIAYNLSFLNENERSVTEII